MPKIHKKFSFRIHFIFCCSSNNAQVINKTEWERDDDDDDKWRKGRFLLSNALYSLQNNRLLLFFFAKHRASEKSLLCCCALKVLNKICYLMLSLLPSSIAICKYPKKTSYRNLYSHCYWISATFFLNPREIYYVLFISTLFPHSFVFLLSL